MSLRFAFVLCVTAGCGAAPDQVGGGGTSNGSLSLAASDVQYVTSIAGQSPSPGRQFLRLTATLANEGVGRPLSTAYPLFSVITASNVSVQTDGWSSLLQPACAADLSVVSGGQVTCALAFELPMGDPPRRLVYDDVMGHSAAVDIAAASPHCLVGSAFNSQACAMCAYQYCMSEAQAVAAADQCTKSISCREHAAGTPTCADYCGPCEACPTTTDCGTAINALLPCLAASCSQPCGN